MNTSSDRRIQTLCLLILTGIALGGALYWLRPVAIPFVLAVFVALGFSPVVDFLMRKARLPRYAAVLGTLLLALLGFVLLGSLITRSVRQIAGNVDQYEAKLRALIASVAHELPLQQFGVDPNHVLDHVPLEAVGQLLVGTGNTLLDLSSQSFLVLIFVIYLLSGERSDKPATGAWGEIQSRVKSYLVTKVALSALTGVLVWLVLWVLDVDLALVFGLFAFLLNFIPNVGSIIATLLPLPVVLVSPDLSDAARVLAIVLPGAVQVTVGNVVEPKVMGDSLDLHPIVIILALIFWGMLWGIVGMLLATPITAIAKILLSRLDPTKDLAEVLGGRMDSIRGGDEPVAVAVAVAAPQPPPQPQPEAEPTAETEDDSADDRPS